MGGYFINTVVGVIKRYRRWWPTDDGFLSADNNRVTDNSGTIGSGQETKPGTIGSPIDRANNTSAILHSEQCILTVTGGFNNVAGGYALVGATVKTLPRRHDCSRVSAPQKLPCTRRLAAAVTMLLRRMSQP
jgi:hypothetical protein